MRWITDLLSPRFCAACDAPLLRSNAVFCAGCAQSVHLGDREREGEHADVVSLGMFGGALATAIRRLKYDDRPDLAEPLGTLLGQACRREGVEVDRVVPVPLHPRRLAERGYNQSGLLARAISRRLDHASLRARMLRRTVDTPPQAGLSRPERLANVLDAFEVAQKRDVLGRRVLLVDDVFTTGTTLHACARALEMCGATSVLFAVVARALRESGSGGILAAAPSATLCHTSRVVGKVERGPTPPQESRG